MPYAFGIDIAGDIREILPHQKTRQAAGELNHLEPTLDFGSRFRQGLAMFAGDQRSQFLEMHFQQSSIAKKHTSPLDDRHLGPGRKGGLG